MVAAGEAVGPTAERARVENPGGGGGGVVWCLAVGVGQGGGGVC